jgi:hypothetical protein
MHVFYPKNKAPCTARGDKPPTERRRKFMDHLDRVHDVFAEGIRQGVLHAEVSPADYVGIIEGSLRFFIHAWARDGHSLTHKQGMARLSRSLLPLLWAHPAGKAKH